MKKVLIVLLVLLTSFGFSENLDKYESKRVFDKSIQFILDGNYEKLKNDTEMSRVAGNITDAAEAIFAKARPMLKEHKYKVIDVKEKKDISELTVKVEYKVYENVSQEESENFMIKFQEELDEETEGAADIYDKKVQKLLQDNIKSKGIIKDKIIKVYMDKEYGYWDLATDKNEDLLLTLFSVALSQVEDLSLSSLPYSKGGADIHTNLIAKCWQP